MHELPLTTLADLVDAYSKEYLPLLKPQTRYHRECFFGWLKTDLGAIPLTELSDVVLRTWKTHLLTRYKPGTVRTYLSALNTVLNVGVRDYQWLAVNPLNAVVKPPMSPGRKRFLSDDERVQLLRACQASRQPALLPVVLVALATGLRKQNILRLCWPQVDFTRGLLQIPETKNGEGRSVRIPDVTQAALAQWQKGRRFDVDWVFPRADGRKPIYVDVCWTLAVKRAGLEDFRFHDLRHTTGSYLAMSGSDIRVIAEVLGQKTLAMAKRYSHLTPSYTGSFVDRMAAQFLV